LKLRPYTSELAEKLGGLSRCCNTGFSLLAGVESPRFFAGVDSKIEDGDFRIENEPFIVCIVAASLKRCIRPSLSE
jgi:hypothetical protein